MNTSQSNNFMESVKNICRMRKEIVDLACSLINARTENPPGDEILAVRIVEDFLSRYKFLIKFLKR